MNTREHLPHDHPTQRVNTLMGDVRSGVRLSLVPLGLVSESQFTVTSRERLGALFSAYRKSPFSVEVSKHNPLAQPMTIAEVAASLNRFSPRNQAAFRAYEREFAAAGRRVVIHLPAYDLQDGNYLLLDGNHRSVAILTANVPFEVTLAVLHGPVDRDIVTALKYWDRRGLTGLFYRRGRGERRLVES